MSDYLASVPQQKAYRLLNHGPTVLLSSRYNGEDNVMAAAWACVLDFNKISVVIDSTTKTRELVEKSGCFVIQIPTVSMAQATHAVGTRSLHHDPQKLQKAGIDFFDIGDHKLPFVKGCAAWMVCKVIPETHNQNSYDLFIGEVTEAWSDTRVFKDGHWLFETAPPAWRSIHHIAGGHYYAIGDAIALDKKVVE